MTTWSLHLALLSDWRVGTGTGRHGQVDRLVARDGDGLPYVPAKTLVGVWRDACEVAATALDRGGRGVWHAWVEYVFGSQSASSDSSAPATAAPRPAALAVTDVRLPDPVRAVLRERPALADATTFLKPGIAIGRDGHAASGSLRFDEMCRAGLALTATAEVAALADLDPDRRRCVTALLAIGADLLEQLGGSRRRGAGHCRLSIREFGADLNWVRDHSGEPPAPPPVTVKKLDERLPNSTNARQTGWDRVELRLRLVNPTIVGERIVGNAVRSADRLPGRLLLPAVLRLIDEDAAHLAARAGDLVVTDATVEADGAPVRPAPSVLMRDKTDAGRMVNLNVEDGSAGMVPVTGYVSCPTGGMSQPRIVDCPKVQYTHNSINDTVQRPTQEIGGLYTYEAIAAGITMRAEVRVVRGVLRPGWHERLSGTLRLGRSRKNAYGRVEVTASTINAQARAIRPASFTSEVLVWLLSDLLVHDVRLRPSTDLRDVARVLGEALGAHFTPMSEAGVVIAASARRTEGWHTRWGLPQATQLGIAAGTCMRFRTSAPLHPARVEHVEAAGIGLRRAEGHGQLLLDDRLLSTPLAATLRPASAESRPEDHDRDRVSGPAEQGAESGLDVTEQVVVRVVERAAWIAAIRDRAQELAASAGGRTAVLGEHLEEVTATQLAGLRQVLRGTEADVRQWLTSLTATDTRRRRWPETVITRLSELLTDAHKVWRVLGLPEAEMSTGADTIDALRIELRPFALRVLVDDCLTAQARNSERRR